MPTFPDRLRIDEPHLHGALSGLFCCRVRILNPVRTNPDHAGPWQPMLFAGALESQVRDANNVTGNNCMVDYEHRETIRHTPDDTRPILLLPHF